MDGVPVGDVCDFDIVVLAEENPQVVPRKNAAQRSHFTCLFAQRAMFIIVDTSPTTRPTGPINQMDLTIPKRTDYVISQCRLKLKIVGRALYKQDSK